MVKLENELYIGNFAIPQQGILKPVRHPGTIG